MPYRRATLLAAALFAAAALAPAASAQIQLGRYESRHGGALLRCGGFAGTCAPHVLAGSLTIETTGPPPAGQGPTFVITAVPPFERVWFFASGLTDVGVTLHVRDLSSPDDAEKFYFNPVGRDFPPIFDTAGFPFTVLP